MKIYQSCNLRMPHLWQGNYRHYAGFHERNPEPYQPKQGPIRSVIEAVIHKLLDCGNLEQPPGTDTFPLTLFLSRFHESAQG